MRKCNCFRIAHLLLEGLQFLRGGCSALLKRCRSLLDICRTLHTAAHRQTSPPSRFHGLGRIPLSCSAGNSPQNSVAAASRIIFTPLSFPSILFTDVYLLQFPLVGFALLPPPAFLLASSLCSNLPRCAIPSLVVTLIL